MIKIMICDDQSIVREGLITILEADEEISVIATAKNGQELLNKIEPHDIPDLVLMDLKMPIMNGVQATRRLHQLYPDIKVLILTTYDDDQWVIDAVRAGASGYLLKDTSRIKLVDAIKGTQSGYSFVDPSIAGKVLDMASTTTSQRQHGFSPELKLREKQILLHITRGLSNAEIAAELQLSEGTVRNYTSMLFATLGVTDRTQAAIAALRYGIINLEAL